MNNLSEKETNVYEKLPKCKSRHINYFFDFPMKLKSKCLSFFHLSINSLSKNLDYFNYLSNELKLEFDLFGISGSRILKNLNL